MDIQPDDNLVFDVSLDSLGKLGLIDYIEKTFGIKMEDEQLIKFPSIRKIAEHIQINKLFHKTENQSSWSGDLKDDSEVILPKASFLLLLIVRSVRKFFTLYFRFEVKGTKKDHAKTWIRRYLARHNNVIIMDLAKDLKGSIQKMAEVVKQNKKVLIFPEGTRTTTGEIGDFKKTYAILSTELNIPIVPVAITGAYAAMSSGARRIRRGSKITVEFLPAIYPAGLTAEELNQVVKQQIVKAIH